MHCVVILKHSKKNLVIPSSWIENFSCAQNASCGLKNKSIRIFYARQLNREPNFAMQTRERFSEQLIGCYDAIFLDAFGKFSIHQQVLFSVFNFFAMLSNFKNIVIVRLNIKTENDEFYL